MLVYAGTSPEDEIPDSSNLFMIIADFDTFRVASDALEFGSWAGFSVVPHSKIAFRPE